MVLERFSLPGILVTLVIGILVAFAFVTYPITLFHPLLAAAFLFVAATAHLPTRAKIKQYAFLFGAGYSAVAGIIGFVKIENLLLPGLAFLLAAYFVFAHIKIGTENIPV